MATVRPFGLVAFSGLPTSKSASYGMVGISVAALPTDPIGTNALTLTNLVSGSAIRVEEADGTLREFREADATSEAFTLDVYSAGSAKNNLVIKVRKGTAAPKYLPFTTYVTAAVGSQSVYIAQVADTIAA